MVDLADLTKSMDAISIGIVALQAKTDENTQQIDSLTTDQIAKIKIDVDKALGFHEDITKKFEEEQKAREAIELAIAKGSKHDNNGKFIDSDDVSKGFKSFLRNGTRESGAQQVASGDILKTMSDYCKSLGLDDDIAKDLTVGVDPDGGFFVPPTFSTRISTRVFETSPLRGMAATELVSTDRLIVPLDDDEAASGGWVGETESREATTGTPKLGEIEIAVDEQFAQPIASSKALVDPVRDLESWLMRKIADILSRTENTAFVAGNGVKKPRGFLTYAASSNVDVYERGKIGQAASGASGDVDADGLIALQNNLKEFYQAGASWVMKRSSFTNVMQLKSTDGVYLLNPAILFQGAALTLLGKGVKFFDDMPAIAANALAIGYADWDKAYTIVDRMGLQLLRDPFTQKGFVKFYTTKRTGGSVVNFDAIKLMKIDA